MARLFDDASSEKLIATTTPITAYPITVCCWFTADDVTIQADLLSAVDGDDVDDGFRLLFRGNLAGDPVMWRIRNHGTGEATAPFSSTGVSANPYHHAAGVSASSTDHRAFIDGGSKGTSANTVTFPVGLTDLHVGAMLSQGSFSSFHSGNIAEVAIWNVALTDAEIAWLATGASPLTLTHRIGNLVFYHDLIRDLLRPGIGAALTATGTTVSSHPRIIYPAPTRTIHVPAAAVGNPWYAYAQQ